MAKLFSVGAFWQPRMSLCMPSWLWLLTCSARSRPKPRWLAAEAQAAVHLGQLSMDDMTALLVDYSVAAPPLPTEAVSLEVKRHFLDTIGCALRSLSTQALVCAHGYASRRACSEGAVLWGSQHRVDAETAALANGVAVRALDLNDSYFGIDGLHPSDVIPGIVAVGEQVGSSGRDIVAAIALAYDVGVSLCDSFSLRRRGWDHVNLTALGACCGISRILKLSRRELGHALALTHVPHAASFQTRVGSLSMWKSYAAADAVRQSVYASYLAAAGVDGPAAAFAGKYGFEAQLHSSDPTGLARFRKLAEDPSFMRILDTHLKYWPIGYLAQAPAECALRIHDRLGHHDLISNIFVSTYSVAKEMLADEEKWRPRSRETADHSIPYAVAEMLLSGDITESSFASDRFTSDEARQLMRRVDVEVEDAFSKRYPAEFPAQVKVRTECGAEYIETVSLPYGHANRPLSDADLSTKFHSASDDLLGRRRSREVEEKVMHLDDISDIREVTMLLVASSDS